MQYAVFSPYPREVGRVTLPPPPPPHVRKTWRKYSILLGWFPLRKLWEIVFDDLQNMTALVLLLPPFLVSWTITNILCQPALCRCTSPEYKIHTFLVTLILLCWDYTLYVRPVVFGIVEYFRNVCSTNARTSAKARLLPAVEQVWLLAVSSTFSF